MFKGLYTAASGMSVGLRRTDVIANNLANSSTPGFKRELLAAGSYLGLNLHRVEGRAIISPMGNLSPIGGLGTGVVAADSGLDPRFGSIDATGRPWDIAIEGPGMFLVQHGNETGYTRRGDLRVNSDGFIVTGDGGIVLGETGPLRVPLHGRPVIDDHGVVTVVAGEEAVAAGRIQLVEFPVPEGLEKGPLGTAIPTEASGPPLPAINSWVRQGYLELSNANPVTEMAEMMAAFRAYEASQRAVHALDQALSRATDLGRIG